MSEVKASNLVYISTLMATPQLSDGRLREDLRNAL
jgi:hypothetical protein